MIDPSIPIDGWVESKPVPSANTRWVLRDPASAPEGIPREVFVTGVLPAGPGEERELVLTPADAFGTLISSALVNFEAFYTTAGDAPFNLDDQLDALLRSAA